MRQLLDELGMGVVSLCMVLVLVAFAQWTESLYDAWLERRREDNLDGEVRWWSHAWLWTVVILGFIAPVLLLFIIFTGRK